MDVIISDTPYMNGKVTTRVFFKAYIDSLDRLTFQNQLISILLVVPTGQHLHAIFPLYSDIGATQGK